MEPHEVKHLEEQVAQAVQTLLAEGDQDYLRGLTPDGLLQGLESELYFLGFYRHDDLARRAIVHAYLARQGQFWIENLHKKLDCQPVLSAISR